MIAPAAIGCKSLLGGPVEHFLKSLSLFTQLFDEFRDLFVRRSFLIHSFLKVLNRADVFMMTEEFVEMAGFPTTMFAPSDLHAANKRQEMKMDMPHFSSKRSDEHIARAILPLKTVRNLRQDQMQTLQVLRFENVWTAVGGLASDD
jgi:hypothetical protein